MKEKKKKYTTNGSAGGRLGEQKELGAEGENGFGEKVGLFGHSTEKGDLREEFDSELEFDWLLGRDGRNLRGAVIEWWLEKIRFQGYTPTSRQGAT